MTENDYVKPAVIKKRLGVDSRVLREAFLNDELPEGAVWMSNGGALHF